MQCKCFHYIMKETVFAERFIIHLNNKIYKYMTSTSKNVYIDKLDDIVNKCNNTYHRTIKPSMYIHFNKKDPKFEVVNNVLQKAMFQVGLETLLWLKRLKILCRGHVLLAILREKKVLERFPKNNCKKQIKKSLDLKTW